jgi:hypothetical protein
MDQKLHEAQNERDIKHEFIECDIDQERQKTERQTEHKPGRHIHAQTAHCKQHNERHKCQRQAQKKASAAAENIQIFSVIIPCHNTAQNPPPIL